MSQIITIYIITHNFQNIKIVYSLSYHLIQHSPFLRDWTFVIICNRVDKSNVEM